MPSISEYRVTQLFERVRAGCAADALNLPSDDAFVLNYPSKEHDETCFSLATVRAIHKKSPKRLAVFDLLLASGGDPNYGFLTGTTLFQLAVWADDLVIVRRFMESPRSAHGEHAGPAVPLPRHARHAAHVRVRPSVRVRGAVRRGVELRLKKQIPISISF